MNVKAMLFFVLRTNFNLNLSGHFYCYLSASHVSVYLWMWFWVRGIKKDAGWLRPNDKLVLVEQKKPHLVLPRFKFMQLNLFEFKSYTLGNFYFFHFPKPPTHKTKDECWKNLHRNILNKQIVVHSAWKPW